MRRILITVLMLSVMCGAMAQHPDRHSERRDECKMRVHKRHGDKARQRGENLECPKKCEPDIKIEDEADIWRRFDYLERRNAWNVGVNAAGIRQDSVSKSYAEGYFTMSKGGFVNNYESDDSWSIGARTESIRHFKKISFFGGFAYDYFDGENMCGSMFSRPNYYPVDIIEFTPGRKMRETYSFTGGVAAKFNNRWTGGLRVDFEAQNYAKRKDLRHKNTMLDFEVAPSVLYHVGKFAVGASYIFGKNSDVVEAEQIGQSGKNYFAFFDQGLCYGTSGLWDADAIHLKESGVTGFPIKETTQGAAVQVQYGVLYADVSYRSRRGLSGEKEFEWHKFETKQIIAHAVVTLDGARYNNFIRLNLDWQDQINRENLLGKEVDNGVTHTYIYGSTPIFGRKSFDVGVEYELSSKCINLRVGIDHSILERQSTLMYPHTREQRLQFTDFFAKGIWTFGRFDVTTGLSYHMGGFTEGAQKFVPEAITGPYPQQQVDYYNRSNEYLTATRVGADLGVRCNIKRFYIDLAAHYQHGFDLKYIKDADRVVGTLAFGYNF